MRENVIIIYLCIFTYKRTSKLQNGKPILTPITKKELSKLSNISPKEYISNGKICKNINDEQIDSNNDSENRNNLSKNTINILSKHVEKEIRERGGFLTKEKIGNKNLKLFSNFSQNNLYDTHSKKSNKYNDRRYDTLLEQSRNINEISQKEIKNQSKNQFKNQFSSKPLTMHVCLLYIYYIF